MNEEKQKFEGHGNNWHAISSDIDEQKLIDIAKAVCEDKNRLVKDAGEFVGMIGYEPPIRALALFHQDNKNNRNLLDSLYPFFQIGNPVEIKISKIDEWRTKGEAVIEGSIGDVRISFFDTLYFLNKDKYKIGNTYLFNLIGIAHSFMKRTEDLEFTVDTRPAKGKTFDSTRMTAFLPSDAYGGEFTFRHPFTSFDGKVEAFGVSLYRYQFYIMSAIESGTALSFPLFVSENILKDYEPELNDPVTGSGWLQGYLADSLRD